jgi:hypothetical protein
VRLRLLILVCLLQACSIPPAPEPPKLSQHAQDAIAVCGAGIANATEVAAKVAAEIDRRKGGELSAEAKQRLSTTAAQDLSDIKHYQIYISCIEKQYIDRAYPKVSALKPPPGKAHGSEAVAFRTAEGVYILKDPIFAGDCKMESGATVTFRDDQTAEIRSKVSTKQSFAGDFFHTYIANDDTIIINPITSSRIMANNAPKDFNVNVMYLGRKPTQSALRWIGEC